MSERIPVEQRVGHAVWAALRDLRGRLDVAYGPRLRRVELFGSHARGEATAESDVDVFVLLDAITHRERAEVYGIGAEVWMDTGVRIAPLALSEAELARLESLERLLVRDLRRDGLPVSAA